MPILHSIIHKIDKKPDGSPAILHCSVSELAENQARDELVNQFNESYNAKTGKAWGFFQGQEWSEGKRLLPRLHRLPRRCGRSSTIPADKKTLNKFRHFTGRSEGLPIS